MVQLPISSFQFRFVSSFFVFAICAGLTLCCAIRGVAPHVSGTALAAGVLSEETTLPAPLASTIPLKATDEDEAIRELVQRGAVVKRFEVREAETAGLLVRLKREHLTADGHVDSTMINWLARLPALALELRGLPLSDEGLKQLLEQIKPIGLDVSGTLITNRGFAVLRNATQLRLLDCSFTRVDDEGLKSLGDLRHLRHLSLLKCAVTDAGLARLESMSSLRELYLADTRVTSAAIERLRRRLPQCRVEAK